jgi:hypothetical protein
MEQQVFREMLECFKTNIELMFGKKANVCPDCHESMRPDFSDDYICMISLANQSHQGQLVVGFPSLVVEDILSDVTPMVSGEKETTELIHSALRELLNTVCGDFAHNDKVRATYKWLDLGVPCSWNQHNKPFFCKSDGYSGALQYKNEKINIHVSINPYKILELLEGEGIDLSEFLDDDWDEFIAGL